mgnify:CR=1 FL=1
MRITVVGVGYVGLVTAACFAEMGHTVSCLDIDKKKIEKLRRGEPPFYEPGLRELIDQGDRLHFETSYEKALEGAEVCFLAVGTPPQEDGSVDLTALFSAAESVALSMQGPLLIATKSTVPVGTGAELQRLITSMARFPFSIVSNPEFLKEGDAIADCMKPDRIIIGCDDREAEEVMRRLYAPFTMRENRILVMDIASAELTKYAANAMLATRISFMNELSNLCNETGADIRQVRLGIGSDRRIGLDFLYAGVGYGGSCFPKDVQALIHMAEHRDLPAGIARAVEAANERQRHTFAALIKERLGTLEGKRIAIWGLTFKPGTDDLRASPALDIIVALRGAELAINNPIANYTDPCTSENDAAEGADAIVLMTEWKQFRFVDLDRVRHSMRGDLFFDGRNQYELAEMEEKGFSYYGIGVPCSKTVSPA